MLEHILFFNSSSNLFGATVLFDKKIGWGVEKNTFLEFEIGNDLHTYYFYREKWINGVLIKILRQVVTLSY